MISFKEFQKDRVLNLILWISGNFNPHKCILVIGLG